MGVEATEEAVLIPSGGPDGHNAASMEHWFGVEVPR
jgi:hypothetical protein